MALLQKNCSGKVALKGWFGLPWKRTLSRKNVAIPE